MPCVVGAGQAVSGCSLAPPPRTVGGQRRFPRSTGRRRRRSGPDVQVQLALDRPLARVLESAASVPGRAAMIVVIPSNRAVNLKCLTPRSTAARFIVVDDS